MSSSEMGEIDWRARALAAEAGLVAVTDERPDSAFPEHVELRKRVNAAVEANGWLSPTQQQERNDPMWDGTDGAHPAWWRGSDAGVFGACARIVNVLSGADDGTAFSGSPELQACRMAVLALRKERDAERALADALAEALSRATRVLVWPHSQNALREDVIAALAQHSAARSKL